MSDKHQQLDTCLTVSRQNVEDDDCLLLPRETSADNVESNLVQLNHENVDDNKINTSNVTTPTAGSVNKQKNASITTSTEAIEQAKIRTSQRVFSISSFVRFFSFRRRSKYKPRQLNANSEDRNRFNVSHNLSTYSRSSDSSCIPPRRTQARYHSLPATKVKKRAITSKETDSVGKIEETSSQTTKVKEKSLFYRFVRTFSFLYKRNPKSNSKLKRSKSVDNYHKPRTLTNPRNLVQNRSVKSSSTLINSSITSKSTLNTNLPHLNSNQKCIEKPKLEPTFTSHTKNVLKDSTRTNVDSSTPPNNTNTNHEISIKNSSGSTINNPANNRRHLVTSGLETPAVCGIQNHGNTCFINSVVQCLCNTNPLAEYLVLDYYREDIHQHSKISKNRGELLNHFSLLLKSLWSCMYSSDISIKFKKVVSKYGDQYNGYDQHDAQEFLLWLLDKCHEELKNSAKSNNKNVLSYFKEKNSKQPIKLTDGNVSDETAAMESLAQYQTLNSSSVIYELFQGQLRSMLTCRFCKNDSKTFDPYLCLSLPVPFRLKYTIFVRAIFHETNSLGLYGISIEAASTLRDLRDKISRLLKVPEKRLILLHIDNRYGMVEFSKDFEMIQEVFEDYETIFALETPIIPDTSVDSNIEQPNSMSQQMITIVWLNRVGIDKSGPIFGPLFTTLISREISFRKLQSVILSVLSPYLIEKENVDFDRLSSSLNLRIRVVNGLPGKEYLSQNVDHPLFVPSVENALSKTEDRRVYRGPHHLKLMVEWDLDVRKAIIVNDDLLDSIYDKKTSFIDKSVELAKECSKLNSRTTLQDCLDLYFRDESLTAENAWACPECGTRQQCVKQLSVWSLPDIFIIHFKRFRFISNSRRIKINTMVEYPINGLDMLKYVAQRKMDPCTEVNSIKNPCNNSLSKLTYKKTSSNTVEETTYNLYAVCCHHGNMQGGHYTAYCKNPVDNCWYLCDDTKVNPVLESSVNTADAYILFYQKSTVSAAYCEQRTNPSTSSISSGYFSSLASSSCNINHWALQMPPFNYYYQNGKCNTMPARKMVHSSAHNTKFTINSNEKHSANTGHIQTNRAKTNGTPKSASNFNNTFPRIKSIEKKASQ